MEGMDDIIKEFVMESMEGLDKVDQELVALEADPARPDILKSIFRTVHTIKGSCGFLELKKLEKVAHIGENLLARLRDGELSMNGQIANALLAMVDALRSMMNSLNSGQGEGPKDYSGLISVLTALHLGQNPAAGLEAPDGAPIAPEEEDVDSLVDALAAPFTVEKVAVPGEKTPAFKVELQAVQQPVAPVKPPTPAPTATSLGGGLFPAGLARPGAASTPAPQKVTVVEPPAVKTASTPQASSSDDVRFSDGVQVLKASDPAFKAQVDSVVRLVKHNPQVSDGSALGREEAINTGAEGAGHANAVDNNIRVDIALLDVLMNLVGELVLVRNQIVQGTDAKSNPGASARAQRLNLITSKLQEGIMKARLQPIGLIWTRFPRMVRDLARACGKDIKFEMVGEDTELDKSVIEAIKDPLVHLVRNAIDHGVERADVRTSRGKSRQGRLILKAFHEGGQVIIEIIDDGNGIDVEKVRGKAIGRGLVTAEKAARMTEREIHNLIFLPGFSTAEQVTNISGRGVGMDVVKTNIEKIDGTVDITSKLGAGTTFRIKIPLTLAIIPALIVTNGERRYAIPLANVQELVRFEGQARRDHVEFAMGATVCRLRGHITPLLYLNQELKKGRTASNQPMDDTVNIVVLQSEGRRFGLVVNSILNVQEIVVKPLGRVLGRVQSFAGATITGDGRVVLILDVLGLSSRAQILSRQEEELNAQLLQANALNQSLKLLLFDMGELGRMAVPLDQVARLEEFAIKDLGFSGGQEIVKYRRSVLPLVRLTNIFPSRGGSGMNFATNTLQVIVYEQGGRAVGVVVGRILEVVEATLVDLCPSVQYGVKGTLVISGHVVQLLDVGTLVEQAGGLGAEPRSAWGG